MKRLNEVNVYIFDCDGVIIDINELKCAAFGKAVESYPEEVKSSFVENCRNTFGVSRYVKFREFFERFAKEEFNQEKYDDFLNTYSTICKKAYMEADITPGSIELFSCLRESGKKLYIASGSDQEELIEAFKKRDLYEYFEEIYGSPRKKVDCVKEIVEKNKNQKIIFVGDAVSDLDVAIKNEIDFIYMSKYSVQSQDNDLHCRNNAKKIIESLNELL